MDTFIIVERLTQLLTILAFASGIPPCLHMIKTGITKNVPFIFFFLGLLNGVVGTVYGLLVSNATLLYINFIAILINAFCIIAYIAVTKSKSGPVFQLIGGLSFLLFNHLYCVNVMVFKEDMIQRYGLLVFILSFILLASPALEVIDCMKEKSSEGMSVVMILGNLSCSFAWLFYGLLLKDFFIYAPNIVGVSTNVAKGVVKVLYAGKVDKTA